MTRQAWTWVFLALSAPCLSVAQTMSEDSIMFWPLPVVDTLHWGPEPGTVQWSFNDHALHWSTSRFSLDLDPWLTFRHVSGNVSTDDGAQPNQQWDNLRGARFEATLDGSWHVQGSLEELQGLPGAWDAVAMTTATALPGWGRAKVLSDGRVDVARARVSSTRIQGLGDQDTLFWTAAYAPFHWGNMPSPLSFASTAASFPRGGLDWQHQDQLRIGLHAGRWTGTERSELGGSTESLFRQSDVSWGHLEWTSSHGMGAGLLMGMTRPRPWIGEMDADTTSYFEWSSLLSLTAHVPLGKDGWSWDAEYARNRGLGSAFTFRGSGSFSGALSLTRLFALDAEHWTPEQPMNAGVPVSAVLRPAGTTDALWRTELHGLWHKGDFNVGGRAAAVGNLSLAEAWVGWTLQSTWPLVVTAGVEVWTGGQSLLLPDDGVRIRAGLAHQWGMTPGSPTFGAP